MGHYQVTAGEVGAVGPSEANVKVKLMLDSKQIQLALNSRSHFSSTTAVPRKIRKTYGINRS